MTTTRAFQFAGIVGAIFFTALLLAFFVHPNKTEGSTIQGQEYIATTTASNANAYGNTITASTVIKGGYGSLGSVVITGANTGIMNFYDATTSDVNKRTGQKATSTILIASFPASIAAGTYTLDAQYGQGLYLDIVSGIAPTSTITYR